MEAKKRTHKFGQCSGGRAPSEQTCGSHVRSRAVSPFIKPSIVSPPAQ